jgi:hypothetical protein
MRAATSARPVRRGAPALIAAIALVASLVAPLSAATFDVGGAALNFDYTNHTNISPASPDCTSSSDPCVGKQAGDIVRFNNVVTVGGRSVDAVVTTGPLVDTLVTRYDVSTQSATNESWFWVRTAVNVVGALSSFTFTFYEAGTYTGPGTGTPVTLAGLKLSALEIDNNQFVQFSDVQGYTLSADTRLTFDPALGRFQSNAANGDTLTDPRHLVVMTYGAIGSITVSFGRQTVNGTNNFALAFEAISFGDSPVIERGPLQANDLPDIDTNTPVPAVDFSTIPSTTPPDWDVLPTCGVYAATDTTFATPLTGTVAAGTYVTHCAGGSSPVFVPTEYLDGTLVVNAGPTPPGPTPPTPPTPPGPTPPGPPVVTPRFTG